jgi:NAD(P)-dependent dehydrogenase (short-subunit alcohol dehydrogenase family)
VCSPNDTEGMKRLSGPGPMDNFLDAVPLRRMRTVHVTGQATVFLASPLASYITGCVLVCSGGLYRVGSALFEMCAEPMLHAQDRS